MGPDIVVVAGEGVEVDLELDHGGWGVLAGQVLGERLVQPLHLAAPLRVVGPRVLVGHTEGGQSVSMAGRPW